MRVTVEETDAEKSMLLQQQLDMAAQLASMQAFVRARQVLRSISTSLVMGTAMHF
jgi:hypothetical protein